jgi:glucose-6-phosphate dehydrogenase assembly protein OpcA
MSTVAATAIGGPGNGVETVPMNRVEAELDRRLESVRADTRNSVYRARMSNLIIYCDHQEHACRVEDQVPEIVAIHPARVLLLIVDHSAGSSEVTASVLVRRVDHDPRFVSEQVTLRAGTRSVEALPFAVRSLLIGDLPTNLWWACSTPPPLAGPILDDLASSAQQLIYDSLGWSDPNRGVASVSSWLDRFERGPESGRWRIASDLAWRRLKSWRRLLSQGLDPASAPGVLSSVSEVLIEHGPHAVTQAWGLAGWLASRLGWTYQAGKIQENVEIAFLFQAPHGSVRLRIDRLPEGPPEVRRVRITGGPESKPAVLEFASEGEGRLVVAPIGSEVAPRTVAVRAQRIAELIGRQLSDREPDPVFRESMKVAQQLARHVVS